ncbi:MAG: primosomal protein N' [SAR202 cluster bacterium]|nr:primosomal protein N' [SAR202 cluster bacterium]
MASQSEQWRRFAEVAVDAPVEPGRTFSYQVPERLQARPGHLVQVPFGRRVLQGLVIQTADQPQFPETREITGIIESSPPLSRVQMELVRWTSDYYICSLFAAAAPMLPPGGRVRQRIFYELTNSVPQGVTRLNPYQDRVIAYIKSHNKVEEPQLVAGLGQGARAAARRLVQMGLVSRRDEWVGESIRPKTRQAIRLSPEFTTMVASEIEVLSYRAPKQAGLLDALLESGVSMGLPEAREEFGASAVTSILQKGWVIKETLPVDRDPLDGKVFQPSLPVALTPAQDRAAAEIRATMDNVARRPRVLLLEGVTGSGKTEVYLDAVRHAISSGKRAIVLVPEIALTPQTVERFATRFPGNVAVLHSGLSAGQRFDQWHKIHRGDYGVVIGSRSAIFAPQPDLGLIVLDEEHEWTYKQHEASPRYHSRTVALKLAELTGAAVVLGSASPDVVSYFHAVEGRHRLLKLPDRVSGNGGGGKTAAGLATVSIVDMRKELKEGNRGMFSRELQAAMAECIETESQGILFLNRRGSSSYMQCSNCGYGLRCRRCDVAMTYHKDENRLICHYCALRRIPPKMCPKCLEFKLNFYGIGTQSVVEEINGRFPGARVLRWDRDTATGPAEYENLLEYFRSGRFNFLVGTQMIAKGLHFPSVTLVGVVSADVGLGVPEYRAGERTFQIVFQVAGRAGRGTKAGKVVVQTFQPENYAVRAAARQEYEAFYTQEIAHRREQGNPPFSRIVRLLYGHVNNAIAEREALRFADQIRDQRDSWELRHIAVLGPMPAFPSRIRGHFRWQIMLRGDYPRELLEKLPVPNGWTIDIDPVGLG